MISAAGIPVIEGDMDALTGHAATISGVGVDIADTGARIHSTWQGLAPHYIAPEAGQLLAATGPVQTGTASIGEDLESAATILTTYADEVREIQSRLDTLRTQATEFESAMAAEETWDTDPANVDRSNELLRSVNLAMADFDDAQRRCANALNALHGGQQYRSADDNGRLDPGEYGTTAAQLDTTAAAGGVPWGRAAELDDEAVDENNWLSDFGHGALDVVGLFPVFGEVADGINAAWYAAEGDYVNAGLSTAAMIPFAGWVSTGGKWGVRGYRAIESTDAAKAWLKDRPSMVPLHAKQLPFTPNAKFPMGQKFLWTDPITGKKVRYHAHGPDPDRLPTENSGRGPIYRIHSDKQWAGGTGGPYRENAMNPRSPSFDPDAVNDSHIPFPNDQPQPHRTEHRVFVPNPAAMLDTDSDDQQSHPDPTGGTP